MKVLYDSNQQQTYKDAVQIAKCCADNGAYWYEEPFPFWQLAFYAELRRSIPCRLALGETFYGEAPFYDAVSIGAADVLMLNLHKVGGVTAWSRIAALSALAGIPLSSHTMPEVSAHVMSATPKAEMLEYMTYGTRFTSNHSPLKMAVWLSRLTSPRFGLRPSEAVRDALGIP